MGDHGVPVGIWNTFFDAGTSRVLRQGIDLSRLVAVESIERRGVPRAHYEHQFGLFDLLDQALTSLLVRCGLREHALPASAKKALKET